MSPTHQLGKMKLGEFISQTLTEIIQGVSDAQTYAKDTDAVINPAHVNWSETKQGFHIAPGSVGKDEAPLLSPIEFEILLTIGEDDKAQTGIGVFAAAFGLGAKAELGEYSENANRIKFQILAKLPQQK